MDTTLRNWALTLGSAFVVGAFVTGHGQLVVDAVAAAGDVAWWLVRPLGPAS